MAFKATVLTLYPEMFPGFLGESLSGKALARGDWALEHGADPRLRDQSKHRNVDDTPAGGGAGMVLTCRYPRRSDRSRRPGRSPPAADEPARLTADPGRVRELAAGEGVVIVCGRFEGVDQRVIDSRGLEEVSIGDYILSGGEPAALILLDAIVARLAGRDGQSGSGTT